MKRYDVIRVVAIRDHRFDDESPAFLRHPQAGDVGVIMEVYPDSIEVECCEAGTALTLWLEAMYPEELEVV